MLSDMLAEVRKSGGIHLGILPGREAFKIERRLMSQGFAVEVTDASTVTMFPSVHGSGLIIEDKREAQDFCLKLIQEGATVREVEE